MWSLFMISVIYRKTSYMTAVNDRCKQLSFFVVNDWGTAVYGRARSTWAVLIRNIFSLAVLISSGRRLRTRYMVFNESIRCRIRPYFARKHVIVLRSYMSVAVYDEIRKPWAIVFLRYTVVNHRIFPVYGRKWAYTQKRSFSKEILFN
jgi:hypothetical protein